ncbi:MAG: SIR2 family protein [Sulfuritalea sp.]|nr:SIR2 family protein [Sulfuritalea sp.]
MTWRDPAGVERALRGEEPQILHLHGAWRWPESIVLGHRSYEDVARDQHAQTVLASLRAERTFIFVGCGAGLRDPNLGAFLRWTASVFSRSEYRHFRLCLESEVEELRREHVDEQRIFPSALRRSTWRSRHLSTLSAAGRGYDEYPALGSRSIHRFTPRKSLRATAPSAPTTQCGLTGADWPRSLANPSLGIGTHLSRPHHGRVPVRRTHQPRRRHQFGA